MTQIELRNTIFNGALNKRISLSDDVLDRMNYEISIIESNNYKEHYFIYLKIIKICNELNLIRSAGRGSSASSLVNYCLDFTKINPMEYGLIPDRFFSQTKYPFPVIDFDIPKGFHNTIIKKLKDELPNYNLSFIAFKFDEVNSYYNEVLIGNIKYKKHPCGILISKNHFDNDLYSFEGNNYYLTKERYNDPIFDKKYNILELDYFNKLQKLVNIIGDEFHPYKIPLDDIKTFNLLSTGDSEGIFQLNNSSSSQILVEFSPSSINDLSILNAMFRPGCLDVLNNVIENKKKSTHIHFENPIISELLKETYGVLVYQETFLHILNKIGGLSYSEAEKCRKKTVRGKNDDNADFDLMELLIDKFREKGLLSNNDIENLSIMIFNSLKTIFPKSHSICYSIIGYWGAFYKANFRKEFEEIFFV